jgi:hypothetical protein
MATDGKKKAVEFELVNLRLDPHIFVNGEPLVLRCQDMHTWGMGLKGICSSLLPPLSSSSLPPPPLLSIFSSSLSGHGVEVLYK